jgi:hypothetical protein
MATSLISQPNDFITISEGAQYTFQGTAPAGAIVTKIAYQWENITDGTLGPIEIVDAQGQVTIDFIKDFESQLTAKVPIGLNTLTDDTIVKQFRVRFGEQVIDTENCTTVTTLGTNSNSIHVVKAYPAFYDSWESKPFLLSSRPRRYCSCGDDWVTIFADAPGFIQVSNNGSNPFLQEGFDAGITHINVDPASFPVPSNGSTEYSIALQGSLVSYDVIKGNCCDCNDPLDVLILEGIGGYSSLRLCLEEGSASRARTNFYFDDRLIQSNDFQNSGLFIENQRRQHTITLKGKLLSTAENLRYLSSLNHSRAVYLKFPRIDDSHVWVKGSVSSASPTYEDQSILNFNLTVVI